MGFRVKALYIAICINQTCPGAKIFKALLDVYDSVLWSYHVYLQNLYTTA